MNKINWMMSLMDKEYYTGQVSLLLNCLPSLKDQDRFAIKGGTAINFFIEH